MCSLCVTMSLTLWFLLSFPSSTCFIYLFIYLAILNFFCLTPLLPPLLFVSQQKFPHEGLANVVSNVFDFDSYNKDMREVVYEVLHKHGIPVGAKPTSVKLAKE